MKLTASITPPLAVWGNQRLLVPAYFSPRGSLWQDTSDAIHNSLTTAVLVMNPDSGPGTELDIEPYRSAMEYCQARRQTVIGYVNTRNTDDSVRSLDAVQHDIDLYYEFYGGGRARKGFWNRILHWFERLLEWLTRRRSSRVIGGIFFDQMSNDADTRSHYRALYTYVKLKSLTALVVGNPGIPADDAWQLTSPIVADVLVVFEGPYEKADQSDPATPYMDWLPPEWVTSQPAPRLAHLVYESPNPDTTKSICIASQQKGAGCIYVTQDTRPNPWDVPPDTAMIASSTLYRRSVIGP